MNGQKVGYSEGSRTPVEFDITPYIKEGPNKLAVEVYRWCNGSWFEDQDFWRLAGIFRQFGFGHGIKLRGSTIMNPLQLWKIIIKMASLR